jgi:uncharacterized protein (UPF0335 family)
MPMRGLTKRTKQQRDDTIIALSKKPIRDLWEKHALVKAQQKHVFDLYVKAVKGKTYKEVERLEHESAELAEQENDINNAIKVK